VGNDNIRCFGDTPIYIDYHYNEWGRPVHVARKLFEMLILEGAQAGLAWITEKPLTVLTITNAKLFLEIAERYGSFDRFISWSNGSVN